MTRSHSFKSAEPVDEPLAHSAGVAALALIALVPGCVLGALAGWLTAGSLFGAPALMSGVLAMAAACRFGAGPGLDRWGAPLLAAMAAAGATVWLATLTQDHSFDGQRYHMEAIWALKSGWNPLSGVLWKGPNEVWINGYAKAAWIWGAVLADLGLGLEAGKSVNALIALAGASAMYAALRDWQATPRLAAWVAALCALNPVLSMQWATNYNDSLIGSSLLVVLASLLSLASPAAQARPARSKVAWLTAALALALIVNIKQSGLAYALLLLVLGAAALWLLTGLRSAARWGATSLAAVVFGVCVLGWNPYITNTLARGNPMYPLMGSGKVDIMSGNRPTGVDRLPQPLRLGASVLAESEPTLSRDVDSAIRLKWPGSFRLAEWESFWSKTDTRVGGFGPWFSLGVLLSVLAMAFALSGVSLSASRGASPGPKVRLAVVIASVAWISAQAFPEAWWARYVPQLWLAPVLLAGLIVMAAPSAAATALGRLSLIALSVNALAIASLATAGQVARELDARAQLHTLARISRDEAPLAVDWGDAPGMQERLTHYGVRTTAAPLRDCAKQVQVHFTPVILCLPAGDETNRYRDTSILRDWVQGLMRHVGATSGDRS